jgi:hypothetical protein
MDTLFEEGDYVENFDTLISEIEAEENSFKKIELINEKYNKVYFMHEKGYLTFLRGNVYTFLASMEKLLAGSLVPEPPPFELRGEEEADEEEPAEEPDELELETCSTEQECKQLLGGKIIEIAETEKVNGGVNDISVEQDTGAESFECLVLQIAYTESRIRHCTQFRDTTGNPLYCEGDSTQLITGDEFDSLGIMQINIDAHPNVSVADFAENVRYGINLLIDNYNTLEKLYSCYENEYGESELISYTGWQRALRAYNGWNSPPYCDTGNPRYVNHVLNYKDEVVELFPEVCGS